MRDNLLAINPDTIAITLQEACNTLLSPLAERAQEAVLAVEQTRGLISSGLPMLHLLPPQAHTLHPLARLPASRVRSVTFSKDPHLGPYLSVEVAASASEALELWERLIEELYPLLRMPLFVVWSGGVDLSPAELGSRLGRLLARMRVSPLTLSHPVDAVEELEREW
jgi:hypothetical protein